MTFARCHRYTMPWLLLALVAGCGGRSRERRADEGGVRFPDASFFPDAASANGALDASEPAAPALTRGCPGATASGVGLETCADGVLHRAGPVQCPSVLPRPPVASLIAQIDTYLARGGDPAEVQCRQDTDCTARAHGQCEYHLARAPFAECVYGCVSDADCAPRQACVCGTSIGRCEPAACRSDADCDPGYACTSWQQECSGYRFSCESDRDECRTSADCPAGLACELFGDGRGCRPPTECEPQLN